MSTIRQRFPTSIDKKDDDEAKSSTAHTTGKSRAGSFGRTLCLSFLVLVLLIFVGVAYFVLTRLGIGKPFPIQHEYLTMKPALPEDVVKVVASLPIPPGNIAVSKFGRIFFNFHPEYNPIPNKILELDSPTQWHAYPDSPFQSRIKTCLSLRIDQQNRLWLLDFAQHGTAGTPTLFAFQLSNDKQGTDDQLVLEYLFPREVAGFGSFLNDFQVDPSGQFVYIADTSIVAGTPGLVIFSLNDKKSYKVLESHPSMFGDSILLNVSNHLMHLGPIGLKVNVDSIALDRTGSHLYFAAVTSDKLFTISTSHLLAYMQQAPMGGDHFTQMKALLPTYVKQVSSLKPVTDGLTTDAYGNIWLTTLCESSLSIARPVTKRRAKTADVFAELISETFEIVKVVESKSLLRWPDGLSFGPDGLYITASALHLKFTAGSKNMTELYGPFHILRIGSTELATVMGGSGLPAAGH